MIKETWTIEMESETLGENDGISVPSHYNKYRDRGLTTNEGTTETRGILQ